MGKKIEYRDEDKEQFLNSQNLHFDDGTEITPEEIWDFLTKVAPVKFPFAFDGGAFHASSASDDVFLPAALKGTYLNLTLSERLDKLKANGGHVAFIQGGQAVDPYTAAGFVALRPALVGAWSRGHNQGNNYSKEALGRKEDKERGYKNISFEACNTAGYEHIQEGDIDVDIVAPYSALRCSDISYSLEAHRHGKRRDEVNLFLGDYPLRYQAEKEWAVEYFAENLKKMIQTLDRISGRHTTEEDLANAVKVHNKGRRIALELAEIWWNAPNPPTNGLDRYSLSTMGLLEAHGDLTATLDVLTEALDSVKHRVEKGYRHPGIDEDAKRLFICGSCVHPDDSRVESQGGIVVGSDDLWSRGVTFVEEEGDPYYNLAKATLSYPYEQSIKERAAWTIEQVKKSRAQGLVFMFNWGCNAQSAVARALCDEVRRVAGIPTIIIENELIGIQPEQQLNRLGSFIEMLL